MTEQITSTFCLSVICCLWPGLWAYVAWNLARHGGRGWWRLIVLRLKAWGGDAGEVE